MMGLLSRLGQRLNRDRRPFHIQATPMRLPSGRGWTVFFETQHGFGAIGWNLSEIDARILATRIEMGERDV